MLPYDVVEKIIHKLILNVKVALYVKNKFKIYYSIPEEDEYDTVENYHWNLSKIKLARDNYIGYMPSNFYYSNILELDVNNGKISNIPDSKSFLKREADKDVAFKEFKKKINEVTQLIKKANNANI